MTFTGYGKGQLQFTETLLQRTLHFREVEKSISKKIVLLKNDR